MTCAKTFWTSFTNPWLPLHTHNRPQCQGVQLVHSGSTKKTLGHQRVGIRQMAIMYPHRYEFPDAAGLGNLETLADLLNEKEQDFERDAHHAAILVSLLQEWFFHLLSPNILKAKPVNPCTIFDVMWQGTAGKIHFIRRKCYHQYQLQTHTLSSSSMWMCFQLWPGSTLNASSQQLIFDNTVTLHKQLCYIALFFSAIFYLKRQAFYSSD